MEGNRPALAMRVIVGQPDWPTPLFSDEMTYVVFSPYWNIPENILREETLPRVASDPDFLRRNNIEVVGTFGVIDPWAIDWTDESVTSAIRLRQRPGPDNALGW
jgi:murein L,D-transpeptidase YcbB/YkuD